LRAQRQKKSKMVAKNKSSKCAQHAAPFWERESIIWRERESVGQRERERARFGSHMAGDASSAWFCTIM